MKDKARAYRNGWSASLCKFVNGYYVAIVRNARGDVHDRIMIDDYSAALAYYRAFSAVAKAA